jgi:hypothetical protein|tara:strand:- start:53 stop:448 length:396 start_codon:yes stop_codon:yes gene_type:complete
VEISFTSLSYFLSTIFLGLVSPIETYTSFQIGTDSIDTKQPMVSFGAQHNINNISFFIEHQSSPMTLDDQGLNHIGLKYIFDNNFYIGSSKKIDVCDICSKGLATIIGYKKRNLFIEYLDKRIYTGLKFTY